MNLVRRAQWASSMVAMGMALVACTFPSVEYDASCMAPMSCGNEINSCQKKAEAEQNMCSMKCSMSCGACDADFDRAMLSCVAQCESCSAGAGCMDATASCKALLGVP